MFAERGRPRVRFSILTRSVHFSHRTRFAPCDRLKVFSSPTHSVSTLCFSRKKKNPFGFSFCGEREIRTPETLSSLPPFQGGGINRYPTSPKQITRASSSICLVDYNNIPQTSRNIQRNNTKKIHLKQIFQTLFNTLHRA
jgi:hypothetical protein